MTGKQLAKVDSTVVASFWAIIGLLAVIYAFGLFGRDRNSGEQTAIPIRATDASPVHESVSGTSIGSSDPSYSGSDLDTATKLAIIDAGHSVSSDDSRVDRYRAVLEALRDKYGHSLERGISVREQERRIGEVLTVAQRGRREGGLEETLLDVARHLDAMFDSESASRLDLAQVATIYGLSRD